MTDISSLRPVLAQILKSRLPELSLSHSAGHPVCVRELIRGEGTKAYLIDASRAVSATVGRPIKIHLVWDRGTITKLQQFDLLRGSKLDTSAENTLLLVAYDRKMPVGFVLGRLEPEMGYILDEVKVLPGFRGRGIGTCLLKTLHILTFEMGARQIISVMDKAKGEKSPASKLLRATGFETVASGMNGENILLTDLTATVGLPDRMMFNDCLIARLLPRAIAHMFEWEDAAWHRRVKIFQVPMGFSLRGGEEPPKGLPQELRRQLAQLNKTRDLAFLIRKINWRNVPGILPYRERRSLAALRKDPTVAALNKLAFRADPAAIPFIRETTLFSELTARFGRIDVVADGGEFFLHDRGGNQIGSIGAENLTGIFTLYYHGKLHPAGEETHIYAFGKRRYDMHEIDVGDLYYLLNIFYHHQRMGKIYGKQVPSLIKLLYSRLRGETPAIALITFLHALNQPRDKESLNNFIGAFVEATRDKMEFEAFFKLTQRSMSKGLDWDKLNTAAKFILKIGRHEYKPFEEGYERWAIQEKREGHGRDELWQELSYFSTCSIIEMVNAGADYAAIDKILTLVLASPDRLHAEMILSEANFIFKQKGLEQTISYAEYIQQVPKKALCKVKAGEDEDEEGPKAQEARKQAFAIGGAFARAFARDRQDLCPLFLAVLAEEPGLGRDMLTIAGQNIEGVDFIGSLSDEIKLVRDRRIKEKLTQVLIAGWQFAQKGEGRPLANAVERARHEFPNNAYKRLDRILSLIQSAESEDDLRLVADQGIDALQEKTLERLEIKFGFKVPSGKWPVYTPGGFVRSARTLLRQAGGRRQPDPNVRYMLKTVARYGSVQKFYRYNPHTRRTIEALKREGYNTDYLVFGKGTLLSANGDVTGPDDVFTPWFNILRVAKTIFPVAEVAPLERSMRAFKDPARKTAAAAYWQSKLRAMLAEREIGPGEYRHKEELLDLLNGVEWQAEHGLYLHGGWIESRKGTKAIPEMFFDNRRLSCCVFMPGGEENGEMPLIAMDPQTPMIEFWISELDEFMGAAIEYAGKNRTMLLDTFEFGASLTSVLGNQPTFKFVLDSLVKDAALAGAEKLPIYDCKYGHPLEFVNYVRSHAEKFGITFDPAFDFELADPDGSALNNSRNGLRLHYTDAFRTKEYTRGPMQGKIPVFVVDVKEYAMKFGIDLKLHHIGSRCQSFPARTA